LFIRTDNRILIRCYYTASFPYNNHLTWLVSCRFQTSTGTSDKLFLQNLADPKINISKRDFSVACRHCYH